MEHPDTNDTVSLVEYYTIHDCYAETVVEKHYESIQKASLQAINNMIIQNKNSSSRQAILTREVTTIIEQGKQQILNADDNKWTLQETLLENLEAIEKKKAENEQIEKKGPGRPKQKKSTNTGNMTIEQMFNYDNNL